jgi:hypothetical protein
LVDHRLEDPTAALNNLGRGEVVLVTRHEHALDSHGLHVGGVTRPVFAAT